MLVQGKRRNKTTKETDLQPVTIIVASKSIPQPHKFKRHEALNRRKYTKHYRDFKTYISFQSPKSQQKDDAINNVENIFRLSTFFSIFAVVTTVLLPEEKDNIK